MLDDCAADLGHVEAVHASVGSTSTMALYLTRYALIRACGAVEVSYKALVADYCSRRSKKQVKHFLSRAVRYNSKNPSYDNICSLLKQFDATWHQQFKAAMKARSDRTKLTDALSSLVDARNDFAHGGSPSITLGDVEQYFRSARLILEELDAVVS